MKFRCDRCRTRYSIADEKVRGKVLKVRCKACQAIITVREEAGAPAPEEWFLSVDGVEVGPLATEEAQARVARCLPGAEVFAWRDDFTEWLRVQEVPALAAHLPEAGDGSWASKLPIAPPAREPPPPAELPAAPLVTKEPPRPPWQRALVAGGVAIALLGAAAVAFARCAVS